MNAFVPLTSNVFSKHGPSKPLLPHSPLFPNHSPSPCTLQSTLVHPFASEQVLICWDQLSSNSPNLTTSAPPAWPQSTLTCITVSQVLNVVIQHMIYNTPDKTSDSHLHDNKQSYDHQKMGHLKKVLRIKWLLKLIESNLKRMGNLKKIRVGQRKKSQKDGSSKNKVSKGWVIEKKDGSSKKVSKGWVIEWWQFAGTTDPLTGLARNSNLPLDTSNNTKRSDRRQIATR